MNCSSPWLLSSNHGHIIPNVAAIGKVGLQGAYEKKIRQWITEGSTSTEGVFIRVLDLAREFGVTSETILDKCRTDGTPLADRTAFLPFDLEMRIRHRLAAEPRPGEPEALYKRLILDMQAYDQDLNAGRDMQPFITEWSRGHLTEWKRGAQLGMPEAIFLLGRCYEWGAGVPARPSEADLRYREAAEQGFAAAQCQLGICYELGIGRDRNKQFAEEYYREAAKQGYAFAEQRLGEWCDRHGSDEEGLEWYRKAAAHGSAKAQYNLGRRYSLGPGYPGYPSYPAYPGYPAYPDPDYPSCPCGVVVTKDKVEAAQWYRKAAEQVRARPTQVWAIEHGRRVAGTVDDGRETV
jgi:hypothetical protein